MGERAARAGLERGVSRLVLHKAGILPNGRLERIPGLAGPVIDPRFVNGVGVLRAPSGFSLAARLEGQPPGACTPAL